MFKVGDVIESLGHHTYAGMPSGAQYVVTTSDARHVGFVCDTLTDGYKVETRKGLKTNWGNDGFKLVVQVKAIDTQFKVGDKVRIKNRMIFDYRLVVGQEGVILEIENNVRLSLDFDGVRQWIMSEPSDHIELISTKVDVNGVPENWEDDYKPQVGDKVHWYGPGGNFVISKVTGTDYSFNTEDAMHSISGIAEMIKRKQFILVSRNMEKKIKGYNIKKGFDVHMIAKALDCRAGMAPGGVWLPNSGNVFEKAKTLQVLDVWFEPVFEDVKPTSVVVDTMAGKVTVTAISVGLLGETDTATDKAKDMLDKIKRFDSLGSVRSGDVKIETFKVGCKTFHMKDVPTLLNAINKVL